MKNKVKIWEPGSIGYQRFQFFGSSQESKNQESIGDDADLVSEDVTPLSPISQELDTVSEQSASQVDQETGFSVEKHLENITKESYQRGYEEGRRLGFDEAIQQALKQTHQISENQQQLASSLAVQMQGIQAQTVNNKEQMATWLGALVEEVCRQVLRREIQTSPEHIIRVIKDTLMLIPNESEYVIHVSENDAELLSRIVPDLGVHWHMMPSSEIASGDCLIVAKDSEAEAKMDVRLEECLDIIKESLPAMITSEPSEA
ncbi:MAG: FliH/SctL family protein [Endozoicomonas sp. (ex Botrylloides leachii)]|nr:FliH/SctL family protein [Endozoicomonas sp. (ex Botrylloides leachii)]